jgi:hypothetical protein
VLTPPDSGADEVEATSGGLPGEDRASSSFVLPWATPSEAGPGESAPLPAGTEGALASEADAVEPSAVEAASIEPGPEAAVGDDRQIVESEVGMPPMHAPVLTSASVGGNSRAGAYLPPSPVRAVQGAGPAQRAAATPYAYGQPPEPAPSPAAWPPPTAWAQQTVPAASPAIPADTAEPAKPLRPGRAALLSDLPFDPPADLAGWLVAAGALGGAIAFLLPWSPQILGSPNFGSVSYWGQWGLGAPSHLAPFLLIVALAMLAVLPNALPAWLKTGVLPLVMGAFLIGLLWPYLVAGFGSRIGATVEAFAAFLLIGGGFLTIAPRRGRTDEDAAGS